MEYKEFKRLTGYTYCEEIHKALYDMARFCTDKHPTYTYSKAGFYEPRVAMLTFAFTEAFLKKNQQENIENRTRHKNEISLFTDRLNKWFLRAKEGKRSKASTFKPHFVWVRETKRINKNSKEFKALTLEEQKHRSFEYPHYHMMVFFDQKFATPKSLQEFLAHLASEEEGVIRPLGWLVSKTNKLSGDDALSKCLKTRFADFMRHASYLAKEQTKPKIEGKTIIKGNWNRSQMKIKRPEEAQT